MTKKLFNANDGFWWTLLLEIIIHMASEANLTENDRTLTCEPYNPIYNLIPVSPVIVNQYVTWPLPIEDKRFEY